MFLGHFGVGMGAKTAAPRVSLGTLLLAAQFVDLLWPTLLLVGLEQVEILPGATRVTPLDFVSYPITHSLLMSVVWALVVGLAYRALRRDGRGALVVGLAVLSHWFLDLLVHRPDLPLAPGMATRLGLGLWNHPAATFVAEGLVFAAGIGLYLRTTRATDGVGVIAFWALIGLLVLSYVASVAGPPPPDVRAIAWVGQAQWLFVAMGYWVDRHRSVVARGH